MGSTQMILKWPGVETVKVSNGNTEVYYKILCICLEFLTVNS